MTAVRFYLFWIFAHLVSCVVELELISLLPKTIPIAPALPFTLPALELAKDTVNQDYGPDIHMSIKLIYNTSHRSCDDANDDNPGRLAEYYYESSRGNRCPAVAGSICGGLYEATNLAKEWNILLISTGLVEEDLFNNDVYPTAISLGSAFDSYAIVIFKLLVENYWEHVSILVDSTAVSYYKILGTDLLTKSKNSTLRFSFDLFLFNNSKPATFSDILGRIRPKSRVTFLLAPTGVATVAMEAAQAMGMTTPEYVYFVVQPLEQDVYGKVALLTNASTLTNDTLKTLVYITARKSDERVAALNRQLVEKSAELNQTVHYGPGNQPLDSFSIRATYDSVVLFARVVDETMKSTKGKFHCDGSGFAARMTDRRFWLRTGPTYITEDGTRHLDLDIYGYDTVDLQMKPVRWFNSVDTTLYWLSAKNESIYSPLLFPPPDTPACGFSGIEGICKVQDTLKIILPPCISVAVLLITGGLVARYLRRVSHRSVKWWLIQAEEVSQLPTMDAYMTEWKGSAVWIASFPLSQPFNVNAFARCPIIRHLEHIDHPNINKFYGIVLLPSSALLVSNYCQRGSLSHLTKTMTLDWQLKFPLLRQFVKALHYVHHSHLRYHGELAANKCLVDSRFTLKLSSVGLGRIEEALKPAEFEATKGHGIAYLSVGGRHQIDLLRKKDIYDCGTICWDILQSDLIKSENFPLKRSKKFEEFVAVLKSCTDSNTKHRASIQALRTAFDSLSNSKSEDVVGLVLKRVEKSTEILEDRVAAKTKELLLERAKCDALLKEILPADLPGFVAWIADVTPYDVVILLNKIYTIFDDEITRHGLVQKIETISDCYMVASGVPVPNGTQHAAAVCRLAQAMQKVFASSSLEEKGLAFRVGIHSDQCAASVIGSKAPRYCLFGDAVNTASRMESNGEGGRIHLSPSTAHLIASEQGLVTHSRGKMQIKGKGEMETYWLLF